MPNKLFLRPISLAKGVEPNFQWALYDIAGCKVKYGASAGIDDIEQTLMQNGVENIELIGLLPSNLAFSGAVSLPGNQTRFIQQALPFAVEDQLSQDVESVHLSHGGKTKEGLFPVISIDRGLFEGLYELLSNQIETANLKAIHLDSDMLSIDESTDIAICLSPQSALIKTQNNFSTTTTLANLQPCLDAIFLSPDDDEDVEAKRIKLFIEEDMYDDVQVLLAELEQYPGVEISVDVITASEFELVCESYFHQTKPPINLCQGEYGISSNVNGSLKKWRFVALIAGVGFLIQLGVFVGKGLLYEKQANELGQLALSEYQKAVPGSNKISIEKLPRIIKGKLNQSKNSGASELGFLALLGEAGYQFQQVSDNAGMLFKSVNYNQQRGELVMEMQASNFDQLEKLKQGIVSAGLSAKISSAVQEEKYFRGRIIVSGS